jgi:hypothetical protein
MVSFLGVKVILCPRAIQLSDRKIRPYLYLLFPENVIKSWRFIVDTLYTQLYVEYQWV